MDNCRNCRFHSVYKRPKIMEETGFGDQLMFADADQDEEVFSCRAPAGTPRGGLEVGIEPIHCSSWQVLRVLTDEQREEMDKQLARFEERMKGRKDG